MTTIDVNLTSGSDVLGFLFSTVQNAVLYGVNSQVQTWIDTGGDTDYRNIVDAYYNVDSFGQLTDAYMLVLTASFSGNYTQAVAKITDISIPYANIIEILGSPPDVLFGLLGNISFNGSVGRDIVALGAGNDTLHMGGGNDDANGGAGNDTLDGGAGADRMIGGTGNDTYYVDNAGDRVIEANGGGTDTVNSTISFSLGGQELENLTLAGSDSINGTGNSIANILNGNAGINSLSGLGGNDTLDGKGGADTMSGGLGNDTYFVDNVGDLVIEANGQGTDTVNSTISFNMGGQEIENLALRGAASINGTGNSIANIITGNSGNNVIDGKGGADTMSGAQGSDTYWVDNAGDRVIEANGAGGIDTVNSTVSFNMGGSEIENLALRGGASINGTGNSIANVINGNSGANVLIGLGGNDTLSGAEGADRLAGGIGNDRLTGGTGNDIFLFDTAAGSANSDVITDFSNVAGNNDILNLENAVFTHLAAGALNAANLRIGGAALDANDYLIYNPATGNLAYDADGSGAGGTVLIANLANHATLTAADFFVV